MQARLAEIEARRFLGENGLPEFVGKADTGGIERLLL